MTEMKERIAQRLDALSASRLDIVDESERHKGHAGSGGGGHYCMTIVSDAFAGKNLMARHRMIYERLSDLMKGEIHALAISAYTPSEFQLKQTSST